MWNNIYVPQILSRKKWFDNSEEQITQDDIVLFKLKESSFATNWVLGKIESVRVGRDGVTRECTILYKSVGETDGMLIVERSTRDVVKLFNIEDTSLYQDIENARRLARTIIDDHVGINNFAGANDTWILNRYNNVEDVKFEMETQCNESDDASLADLFHCQIENLNSVSKDAGHLFAGETQVPDEASRSSHHAWTRSVLNHSERYQDDEDGQADVVDEFGTDFNMKAIFMDDDPLIFM